MLWIARKHGWKLVLAVVVADLIIALTIADTIVRWELEVIRNMWDSP